ncbi:centromere/kinetochore protein zw10 homolog [Corylus avellana]|uniref:centromere/kinetochore protein zw10 homolog n=1 Tax=Corylus avellana TaxID=13451 RepID=UPI00286B6C1C|nr:centromere/kinetochore protein zw10 homolog [Corylus avellana]
MDALFDSINVRDLLSARDLSDPTCPLSAPDLRLLIQRLESHSLHIKSKVGSYLLSHHHHFASLFSLCNDAVSQSDLISSNLSDLLRLISDRPIDVEIRDLIEELSEKTREARTRRELLELARAVVEISERLKGVREGIRNGQLKFAAEEVRELKKALRLRDGDRDGGDIADESEREREPVVYGLLKKEWSDCFEEIQEVLVKFMQNAVRFEGDTNRLLVQYRLSLNGVDWIELRTVLEAMDVVGILDYGLAKLADLIIKYVVSPAVNRGSPISFVEELNQDPKEMTEAVLKIVPSVEPMVENVEGEAIYSAIIQLIKFIGKRICFENGSWIESFGRLTWPRISELIICNFLSKVVPKDASKLADFQKIIECTSQFETALKEMMFISASDNKDEKLSNFAQNVEVHFASRKKKEILGKARKLLLQCDFDVPQEYTRKGPMLKDRAAVNSYEQVVDLLFLSERCVVSKAAIQLMELVHQTLKDVCLSSTRVALEFYRAARDAILLYEVVIPVKLEKQLDGINQVAVLMHNDCLYLSQEILGLAFEYRSDFPSSIKEHAVFVDMAPRFHLMAEEILQKQIQLILYNLKEAVDGADGFQNTQLKQQFELVKFSIDQVIFILEKVHIIWEPLLLPSTYKRSMCMVLESVFSRITRDILLLDDLAADETLQLQRLIHLMLENLSSLFESLDADSQKEKPREDSTPSLDNIIPSLCKIRKLAELLDMPLKSITTAWESGEVVSCGFTALEVKDFIKGIFTDSPLRKECLWRIENSRF